MDGTVADDGIGDAPADAAGESDSEIDGGADGACGPQTCADGTCVDSHHYSNAACGDHGEACETCPDSDAGYYSAQGTCLHFTDGPCNPSNCDGCCFQQTDWCASGIHARACGHGGGHCDGLCLAAGRRPAARA